MKEIRSGVYWISLGVVNAYVLSQSKEQWYLVDSGFSSHAKKIIHKVSRIFSNQPLGILLTHGHLDHSGAASDLADYWEVPVYAHSSEVPFLNGELRYPDPDPTVGGFLAFMMRFMENRTVQMGSRLKALPPSGEIPHMTEWQWISTPGHTHGHISFFRKKDATLIGGDALATMNTDSFRDTLIKRRGIYRPGTPITINWDAAQYSVRQLARLRPTALACGHGVPLIDTHLPYHLCYFARSFPIPKRGRYVIRPIRMKY
ncbi:MBL fold metallo-hydrolase [Hazenella coriacea]|uniref:Glyoxylase-like metal-dependent hydrolase (Beta-lactamase superfamily II) n=1 Tax=Hazenella coriacea TaxID=1179467 RepID=A0A4R3LEN3_9BACL|nr:MBL fold metallo-hydrolase [Hazenella coriacea]TCS95916.1 glyoxylase-like metal-dependent hydrolase (beta-lactamase superfamily II) [Hazenella coriacea]